MRRIGSDDVVTFSRGRAVLETEMCRRMYQVYDSPPTIDRLRSIVALAIEQICVLGQAAGGQHELLWINALKKAGANLAIWPKYAGTTTMLTVPALIRVLRRQGEWTASDCSDLVRLFGGLIEDATLQAHALVGTDVEQLRKAQRPGEGYKPAERAREIGGYHPNLDHLAAAHRAVIQFRRDAGFSGIDEVTLKDNSTVKKIDAAFGLAEGCDISGTTADSLFFFRHVNAFIAGLPEAIDAATLPLIQLLPLATMASQGHHTVLECALTLTLNRIIDYRIGFYSTLLPARAEHRDLATLFQNAERDWRNHHFLCFRNERGELAGTLYETPDEISRLRDASLVNEAFRAHFKVLSVRPTEAELFSLPPLSSLRH